MAMSWYGRTCKFHNGSVAFHCNSICRAVFNGFEKSNLSSFIVFKRYASSLADSVKVKFSRSSGPGGQNVNKLATKAEVRLKVEEADWLSTEVKQSLVEQQKNRINKRWELIVTSDRFRSQSRNLQDAMQKLKEMVKAASIQSSEPSQEKIDRILEYVEKENEKRLLEKKYHSEKKKSRTKL